MDGLCSGLAYTAYSATPIGFTSEEMDNVGDCTPSVGRLSMCFSRGEAWVPLEL